MVDAIVQEALLRKDQLPGWSNQPIQSLYLGGGTPSLLSEEAITRLIHGVSSALNIDLSSLTEITLEANPEDLEPSKLTAWKHAGVRRLSVGIQSFHDETLAWMNRAHSGDQAEQGVRLAAESGFEAITVDLIYGVPTSRNWAADVARAMSLPVQHLSAYALTVEPQTVLGHRVAKGLEQESPDHRTVKEYRMLCEQMGRAGWDHYETSNWAAQKRRCGCASRHPQQRVLVWCTLSWVGSRSARVFAAQEIRQCSQQPQIHAFGRSGPPCRNHGVAQPKRPLQRTSHDRSENRTRHLP